MRESSQILAAWLASYASNTPAWTRVSRLRLAELGRSAGGLNHAVVSKVIALWPASLFGHPAPRAVGCNPEPIVQMTRHDANASFRVAKLCLVVVTLSACEPGTHLTNQAEQDRFRCISNLRSLSVAIKSYAYEYGYWPTTPEQALEDMGHTSAVFGAVRCPGYRPRGQSTNPAAPSDTYVYVDWSLWFAPTNTPGGYPLIYDRARANHSGIGANVALVDGSRFWDRGGVWIQTFCRNHPQYRVPVPR